MRSRRHRGAANHLAGLAAEQRIAQDYERRGFAVARRRWRGGAGEIDLVIRDGSGLIFVEVKQSRDFATAEAHVSPRQIGRIYAAAEEFLSGEPEGSLTTVRFDVALVNQRGEVQILENAIGHG